MNTIYYFPEKFELIIKKLINKNWIIHNFPSLEYNEIYNPIGFLENDYIEYRLFLDVNIYQFILNSVKKSSKKEEFKDALSLLVFCQLCKIEVDPSLAIYEKVNYKYKDCDFNEIVEDLNLFENLNNTNPINFFPYILTDSKVITYNNKTRIDRSNVINKIQKYKSLNEWKSIYLMILKICTIQQENNNGNDSKLLEFINWMVYEYRRSFVIIVYSTILWSKRPISKMMKFKLNDSSVKKKKSIENMTWDLYFLNYYFRKWSGESSRKEFLFASADKAFSELLRLSINCQNSSTIDLLKDYINNKTFDEINKITSLDNKENRKYLSNDWTIKYRDSQIKVYEKKLGII